MKLDPKNTAFLTLDFQSGIVAFCEGAGDAISAAAKAAEFARENKFLLVHVGLGFSEGHPELPDFESPFTMAKKNNLFVKGSPTAEFSASVKKPGELTVYKQRIGAFSENHLDLLLRSKKIEHVVLFGLTTSGIVLSTFTRAFDLNYRIVVLKDACYDRDPEVHRVLTEKVFSRLATVQTVEEFITAQEV